MYAAPWRRKMKARAQASRLAIILRTGRATICDSLVETSLLKYRVD